MKKPYPGDLLTHIKKGDNFGKEYFISHIPCLPPEKGSDIGLNDGSYISWMEYYQDFQHVKTADQSEVVVHRETAYVCTDRYEYRVNLTVNIPMEGSDGTITKIGLTKHEALKLAMSLIKFSSP